MTERSELAAVSGSLARCQQVMQALTDMQIRVLRVDLRGPEPAIEVSGLPARLRAAMPEAVQYAMGVDTTGPWQRYGGRFQGVMVRWTERGRRAEPPPRPPRRRFAPVVVA